MPWTEHTSSAIPSRSPPRDNLLRRRSRGVMRLMIGPARSRQFSRRFGLRYRAASGSEVRAILGRWLSLRSPLDSIRHFLQHLRGNVIVRLLTKTNTSPAVRTQVPGDGI